MRLSLQAVCAALVLQVLAVHRVLAVAPAKPYTCLMTTSVLMALREHQAGPLIPPSLTPNTTVTVGYLRTMGIGSLNPVVITLFERPFTGDARMDRRVEYDLTIDPIQAEVRIDREVKQDAFDPLQPSSVRAPMPTALLVSGSIRYFWFRVVARPDGSGEVLLGRAGQDAPLVTYKDPQLRTPNAYRLHPRLNWLHNCSEAPRTALGASLGCRKLTTSDSYLLDSIRYRNTPPPVVRPGPSAVAPKFPIDQEAVPWGESMRAVRFLVRGTERGYVWLTGIPSRFNYRLEINAVGRIAILKDDFLYLGNTPCKDCLSTKEFRLFSILFNTTRLQLYVGLATAPLIDVPFNAAFQVTHVSYSSPRFTPTDWLHACQGYEKEDESIPGGEARPVTVPPVPVQGKSLKDALAMADQEKCRLVHTFKYRFDSYYAISEEGVVAGSFSGLTFSVSGRRDVHLQLAPSIPPPADDLYEIDIGFHNYTNLDRGKEVKVASVRQHDLLSEKELRTFTIRHDLVTGVLNVTSADGQLQMTWRDPRPFPLRYFSVCSGSSAGNDTVWVFGCWHKPAVKNSCSRPLVTYSYSHSQYFSVEREGVVNGTRRTIFVHLRASGSGHVRLEAALPPGVDALVEVDLMHEGSTSIDSLGRRVATIREPGLLSINELRGFWVRQDTATRRLEVGKIGSADPLVFWTAPPSAKFPELRYFSLATSRSVGNGTWYYGCKEGQKPDVDTIVAVPEAGVTDAGGEVFDYTDLTGEVDSDESGLEPLRPAAPGSPTPPTSSSALLALLQRNLSTYMPTQGTEFTVRLNVSMVYLDDYSGMLVVKGHVLVLWYSAGLRWDPKEYGDIMAVTDSSFVETLAPDLLVPNGDVETGGLAHLHSSGIVRWEAPLSARSYCHSMDASRWPNDQHTCQMRLALTGPGTVGSSIILMRDGRDSRHDWVHARAARPLWHLVHSSLDVRNLTDGDQGDRAGFAAAITSRNAVNVVVTLKRNTPVMNRILIAPFVVLSALSLLAYWVQEPLPRDKVLLGCGSLLLLILSFIMFEAACPPGLIGIPLVLELYCYTSCLVAASVALSAIMTAVARDTARDGLTRGPPLILCRLLSVPLVRLVFFLTSDMVEQRIAEDELDRDGEDYTKASSQLYTRFGAEKSADCGCNDTTCSKQAAIEARYYWTLLSLATERLFSLICVSLLLYTSILVR